MHVSYLDNSSDIFFNNDCSLHFNKNNNSIK